MDGHTKVCVLHGTRLPRKAGVELVFCLGQDRKDKAVV